MRGKISIVGPKEALIGNPIGGTEPLPVKNASISSSVTSLSPPNEKNYYTNKANTVLVQLCTERWVVIVHNGKVIVA